MRRFDKKEKIRKANILLEERVKNLKEYGSEFGPDGEFDDAELQGQEDFYDNMNKETIEDGVNPITGYDLDKPSPGLPKQKPYSSKYSPTTYSSGEIEKSRESIRNNRDLGEGFNIEYLKQLKENFIKTYNKIKRLDENSGKKHWEDVISLENGSVAKIFFQKFKLFTNDNGFRYSVYVNNKEVSDKDLQNILTMISKVDRDNTLVVYKVRVKGGQTVIMIGSTKNDDISAVFDDNQNQNYDIRQKRGEYNPDLF